MEVPVQRRVRRDRERVLIDAATVEGITKRRKVVADGHESEDEENMTDHSMLQYCSDDEENRSGHRVPGFGSKMHETDGCSDGDAGGEDHDGYEPPLTEYEKALKESRTKRPGVKKTASNNRKSSESSAAMPPRRVMALPPAQTKRILEPDEPDRVTRQRETMAAATDHQESLLGMDFESSVEMRDEFLPMDEETTLCMDESGTVCIRLRRGARSIDRNDVVSEEEQ
ncbi:hypothetical protein D1007_09435 [Hordeum vulgare]|nr:hypothetical protein D1007_09435 [Hordeum vulgare]